MLSKIKHDITEAKFLKNNFPNYLSNYDIRYVVVDVFRFFSIFSKIYQVLAF